MGLNFSVKDKEMTIYYFINSLYEKTINYIDMKVWEIGYNNMVPSNWVHQSFIFRGKVYNKSEANAIGIPSLHSSLVPEMEEIWEIERRLLVCEASVIRNMLRAAISHSDEIADLFALLPEAAGKYLPFVKGENQSTLSTAQINQFRKFNAPAIDILNIRLTRNMLGNYL